MSYKINSLFLKYQNKAYQRVLSSSSQASVWSLPSCEPCPWQAAVSCCPSLQVGARWTRSGTRWWHAGCPTGFPPCRLPHGNANQEKMMVIPGSQKSKLFCIYLKICIWTVFDYFFSTAVVYFGLCDYFSSPYVYYSVWYKSDQLKSRIQNILFSPTTLRFLFSLNFTIF